jgi:hypothetical protein
MVERLAVVALLKASLEPTGFHFNDNNGKSGKRKDCL